jgi:hypothetical protein
MTSRLLLIAVALVGCSRSNVAHPDPQVASDLERLRAATRRFQMVDSAASAGYPREVRDCLVHEHHGAMGYHHANRSLADARVEVERPEILLFERLRDGRYRLNGVEFIVPYRAWPRDSVPPTVMGQTMKREDNLNFFYLHVWAWTPNSNGLFADFHPDVACPDSARRVFTPFTRPGGQ